MNIQHLKHKEIDYQKWDECILKSQKPLVYAMSWYLNKVNPKWEALVIGDYDAVFPLPVNKRFLFKRLLQPPYCQQLGLFIQGVSSINELFSDREIPFKFVNINVSSLNFRLDNLRITERNNIILPLFHEYEILKANYNSNTRRNLKKATKAGGDIVANVKPGDVIALKQKTSRFKLCQRQLDVLNMVLTESAAKGTAKGYGLMLDGNLCAYVHFLIFKGRATMIQSVSDKAGFDSAAMFRLIDQFIQEHAGSDITLDFEGSMIPGVARFFKGFGSQNESYYNLYRNNIPSIFKLFMK